ncbi:alpha/beta fold hydrolase [Sulfitobacter delicatus]|uniref:Pimeloyl-ACP methyl ester carboxylesterase n=1 Tax=Sulfitobacter delicatus TaxID=218672 RepID=A0A1G7VHZ3_9RHOB|nr:alpha/beta hydrolase [Sulfitobacter delicatus]SDG59171.1 Pimeloyl-ACP methyl ester carboxylesterase [Sulfitobacter delicatus]
MTSPRFRFVPVMDHEVHVTEWGDPANPALIMAHGLARTGRDFDEVAAALSDSYHVLCPDMIGRGLSSWSRNPQAEYSVEYYAGIATDLMDHYQIERATWLGTSLGGMIGMRIASGHDADRINALIINDISPELPEPAVARILSYVGQLPDFATFTEGEVWLRDTYAPFGPAGDTFWQRMARSSLRRRGDGRLTLHYDPRITVQFTASPHELSTWDRWAQINIPTHVLRGADSDLLLSDAAARMTESGPRPAVTEIADCGHAPNLSNPDDIDLLRAILADLRP